MLKIGIIGTGQISSALVTGFCTAKEMKEEMHFYLSPRNQEKAALLKEQFEEQVTVCGSNQEVIDQASDWVILAVIPRDAEKILSPLSFYPTQKVLTLISDHPVERILSWTGPVEKMVRMVPLPFAALHKGPIAYCPPDEEIQQMFSPLGQLVALPEEDALNTVLTMTSLMSPFYLLIHHAAEWGKAHGMSDDQAVAYMSSFFEALSIMAGQAEDSAAVAELCYDTTEGGLNESAYRSITRKGGYQIWMEALDAVKERLDGAR